MSRDKDDLEREINNYEKSESANSKVNNEEEIQPSPFANYKNEGKFFI